MKFVKSAWCNFSVHCLILNNSEVIDILDFLIERTRAKLKKLEEEFENL